MQSLKNYKITITKLHLVPSLVGEKMRYAIIILIYYYNNILI